MQSEENGHSETQVVTRENSPERIPAKIASTAKRFYAHKRARVGVYALLGVCSFAFYRVRELAAALILFSFLFAAVMIGVVIVWLVNLGAQRTAFWLENHMAHIFAHRIVTPAPVQAKHISQDHRWN